MLTGTTPFGIGPEDTHEEIIKKINHGNLGLGEFWIQFYITYSAWSKSECSKSDTFLENSKNSGTKNSENRSKSDTFSWI